VKAGRSKVRTPFRVPFVNRCSIEFSDGQRRSVFTADINEYGAYIADDVMPRAGQGMSLRMKSPGSETEIEATGAVAWLNPKQQHPVHSFPPGYGVKFDPLREAFRLAVDAAVRKYLKRHKA
jgi:hypothetical protein